MAIEVVSGAREKRAIGRSADVRTCEVLTQSTATLFQNINMFVDSVRLGMGTATGFELNIYRLASGAIEQQQVTFVATATGEAKLLLEAGTATGYWVFSEEDDFLLCIHTNHKWHVVSTSADYVDPFPTTTATSEIDV